MSHACRIPDCPRPAKDGQLMCLPHWRRVPRALNRAIFDTYAHGPRHDYLTNVDEAVRVIQGKEAAERAAE
jgi:hypothetical protein